MDVTTILRTLWQRRLFVAVVAVFAVMLGWVLAYEISFPPKSRSYTVGVATTRILVDTPASQVVDISPKGSETLGSRASLLANLMVQGEVKAAIATRAGVAPNRLVAVSQAAARQPEAGARNAPLGPGSYSLTTGVVTNSDLVDLPMIQVETQAPTPRLALRLATASVAGLGQYLDSKAASEQVPNSRRLQVRGLGSPQASEAARGTGRMMALAAAIFAFLAGCAAILVANAVARDWRTTGGPEHGFGNLTDEADPTFDGLVLQLDSDRLGRGSSGRERSRRSWGSGSA